MTIVRKHSRKGTKGVKTHSRSNPKKKRVNPLAGTRQVTNLRTEYPLGKEPVEAIWKGKRGLANLTKVTSEDVFSGEIYREYIVAFREHGVKFTDPLSKRMGREFFQPFKQKSKAIRFFKTLKVN